MVVSLTLTFPDYARLVPIVLGDVKPEGIDLTWIRGPRVQMLSRALNDPAVQGGEHSLAQHLYRIAAGDRSHVAIPVFPLRNFGARDIFVRRDGGLAAARDLIGKRVGMYSWSASGSVWYRHLLEHLAVPVDALRWTIGPIDEPAPATPTKLPAGVVAAPAGRALSDMLRDGDLDAIVSPLRPRGFGGPDGPLVRLMPNFRAVEQEYYRATRCYPPQHVVILRRAVVEKSPKILPALQSMFDAAERHFIAGQRYFPYASPWLEADIDETDALIGEQPHAHGLEANRATLEAFCDQASRSGLVARKVAVDELFEEYLRAAGR
ncbi:MAG: hypothetical protein JNK67_25070 [Alphaproteobacteria bacterium]|nr:hypothetical protein [Alphaproteobacteria bacterium]